MERLRYRAEDVARQLTPTVVKRVSHMGLRLHAGTGSACLLLLNT